MYSKGFFMGDPNPGNFIKNESGDIIPVDFGLVFTLRVLNTLDKEVKKGIVHDYIKGGYEHIPPEIKSKYFSCIQTLDFSLGENSPTGNMTLKELTRVGFKPVF